MSKEIIPYEELIIGNLVDPAIGTLSRQMGQFLLDNIAQGKNILICGVNDTGRTMLANIICKGIPLHKKIILFEKTSEMNLRDNDVQSLSLNSVPTEQKVKDYYIISKGFSHYEEDVFILDDVPTNSYINCFRLLLKKQENKQLIAILNEQSNEDAINNLLNKINTDIKDSNRQKVAMTLVDNIDLVVNIRKYEDGYIRVRDISETRGYDQLTSKIILDKIFSFITHGERDYEGRLIGDFIRY